MESSSVLTLAQFFSFKVPGNFGQNMPSFSEVELLNSWPKIDLVWIIDFLYPKSILLNYWQLTRMHLMSTRARSSSKLQSVHSRVLEVQFSSDQDHSTWNSNLYAVYVFKFLYRNFLKNRGNKTCSRCVPTWKIFVISLSEIPNWKWKIIFCKKFMFVMS